MNTVAIVDHGSYSTALPREYYFSEDIFQQELRKVFNRQWLLVGHVSSVKSAGDYFVKQVGPESLIITRDQNLRLRAYFNTCRHRGYRILDREAHGNAKGFQCPYHKWAYGTDGCLKAAPGMRNGVDMRFSEWPLQEAWVDSWHGWIYVYLDRPRPTPLAEVMGPLTNDQAIRDIGSERLKLAHRETYLIKANWKVLLENDSECYHCGFGGHRSLAVACDHDAFATDKQDGQHFPLRQGMVTFSMDGKRVCKKPLGTVHQERSSTGFILTPLFCGPVLFMDHAVSLELTPLTKDTSYFVSEWYVHEDAVEGEDYVVDELKAVFHITNQEDVAFAERNFEGMHSQRFVPGPLNPRQEYGIRTSYDQYLAMMQAP